MSKRNWVKASKHRKQYSPTGEIIREIVGWLVVTAIAFVYWLVMLLFASLVLLSYWKVKFTELVDYSIVLTVISSIAYGIYLIRRYKKEMEIKRYMQE